MPSRAQKEARARAKYGTRRDTTFVQDVKDTVRGVGREIAARTPIQRLRERKSQIDKAVDDNS